MFVLPRSCAPPRNAISNENFFPVPPNLHLSQPLLVACEARFSLQLAASAFGLQVRNLETASAWGYCTKRSRAIGALLLFKHAPKSIEVSDLVSVQRLCIRLVHQYFISLRIGDMKSFSSDVVLDAVSILPRKVSIQKQFVK